MYKNLAASRYQRKGNTRTYTKRKRRAFRLVMPVTMPRMKTQQEKKWGYEVRRRGLHKLWSVVRLNGLDDGSEDLVVFSFFFVLFFFSISILYQTNSIESNTKKRFDIDSIPIYCCNISLWLPKHSTCSKSYSKIYYLPGCHLPLPFPLPYCTLYQMIIPSLLFL